ERDLLERGLERHAVGAEESDRRAGFVRAQRGDDATMQRRGLGERRGGEPFERRERRGEARDERGGGIEFRGGEAHARIGWVPIGGLTSPQFFELGAERGERLPQPARPPPPPPAAPDPAFPP